jgi:hypothetical protein
MAMCDVLLRVADTGLYRPIWSTRILDEMVGSVVARGYPRQAIERRRDAMLTTFPEAVESRGPKYEPIVPGRIHEKDRHVVATALAGRADVVVTANLRDFPAAALGEVGLAVLHPDEFLMRQLALAPDAVAQCVAEQASALSQPPKTVHELIADIAPFLPAFAAALKLEVFGPPP